jgi:V/A-type H+-transporting ATPase subunit E
MSCKELIESLRKAAEGRVRLVWQEAEAEAGKINADVALRLKQLRDDMSRKQTLMTADRISRAVSDANSRARIVRLSAEKALSDRLYGEAVASLSSLRKGPYEALFGVMVEELPPLAWQAVRVNPGDVALAKKHFPGAEIVADAGITGGMDVSARSGAVRVVNTFEKRLERAWGDIQPSLIRDAYEVNREASAAEPRGQRISSRVSTDEDQRQTVPSDR